MQGWAAEIEQKMFKREEILTREGVKQADIALTLFYYVTKSINNKA